MFGRPLCLLALVGLAACQPQRAGLDASPAPVSGQPEPSRPEPVPSPVFPTPMRAGGSRVAPSASPATAARQCDYGPARQIAVLQDRAVGEASGLAASWMTPGVYWTLNDSGHAPLIFAFDEAGQASGTFRVTSAENLDWEAVHAGPGADGKPALYIADTGDNRAARREAVVYRVPEPGLESGSPTPPSGRTEPAEAFSFLYPDGARDAESMLVHPATGELLILTKEFSGLAQVYRYPAPLDTTRRVTLERVGELDLRQIGPIASALTDGAVSTDGRRVALRTYLALVELDVPVGASLASIWRQTPRIGRLDDGPQGEGLTYRASGGAILTIGEGTPTHLYRADRSC